MKKILFATIILMCVCSASGVLAQKNTVKFKRGIINTQGYCDIDNELHIYDTLVSTFADSQDFIWEIISDETPTETQMYICDPNVCNLSSSWNDKVNTNDFPLVRKKVFTLKPGSAKMEITYAVTNSERKNPIQGVGKVLMKVYPVGKIDEATTLTINNTFLNSPAAIFSKIASLIYDFKIFPNPATNSLNVGLGIISGNKCGITIINALGVEIYNQIFTPQNILAENIDCSQFVQGTYQMIVAVNGVPAGTKIFTIK